MNILGTEVNRITPVGANVLVKVIKEEVESISTTGIIMSPQKTVFFRAKVIELGANSRWAGTIMPCDYVELTGTPIPCIYDEDGKCTLMMVPDEAIIGVYKPKSALKI